MKNYSFIVSTIFTDGPCVRAVAMRVNKLLSCSVLLASTALLLLIVYLNASLSCHKELLHSQHPVLQVIGGQVSSTGQNIDQRLLTLSLEPDIELRGKFQHTRIEKLCQNNFFAREQKFPTDQDRLTDFHSHLLFDDQKKIIFCFVPKVGCTNMKRLLMYMSESLPMYTLDWPWVDYDKFIVPAMSKVSFLNRTLTHTQKMSRISDYYKFMMIRDPLERLVSAYRDKMAAPLMAGYENQFPDKIKLAILERYRPNELLVWRTIVKLEEYNISVTFPEFCRYITESDSSELNEHFVPSMDICHPCLMNYNFYGNFRNYSQDSAQLIKKFKANPNFYRDESLHTPRDQTNQKLLQYYRQLNIREKVKLLGRLYDELLFYYTLYPSERNAHKLILGIDLAIPI